MILKFILIFVFIIFLCLIAYVIFVTYVPFSESYRSGTLTKFKRRGFLIKTWEGQIRQGAEGIGIFSFSVKNDQQEVIEKMQNYQDQYVRITYTEYYGTLRWRGNTKYFVTHIEQEELPYYLRAE